MPGRMAGVAAEVSTGADLAGSMAAEWVDFTVASRVCTGADLAGFMEAGSTGIDFTMGGSIAIDFAITGAGYYPYVTQCNTGWQAVPTN